MICYSAIWVVFIFFFFSGMEAPRNSMELPMERLYGLYAATDNLLYADNMTEESSRMDYYSTEAPIKKLISEEIFSTKQNAPSVVARLMGVDTLPFDSKPTLKLVDKKNVDSSTDKLMVKERSKREYYYNKPKPREHPQEEELQKFKKEFEAWQAARFNKECSNAQLIAQQELNREKMFLYASNSKRNSAELLKNPKELLTLKKKIVVLKPCPDRMFNNDESWNSTSPSTSEERVSIQDFLEEVKERLKSELQGNCSKRSSTSVRGGGIETPYREKPSEPKKIAWCIAQEVRDSVSRDLGMNLVRSESSRSYRSEIQLNGSDSPEFIDRDARRLLARRLRNVMKSQEEFPRNRSRLSVSGGFDNNADSFTTNESEKDLSPRNLVRSLSAPSFGKLLLEDRRILTGAQIRRKHEEAASEKVSPVNIKKQKKEKFSIKEKVSSFKYSLTLRGRLFRRKVRATDQIKNQFLKDITNGPTVTMNISETHENSTEVPPSPASVCSSVHEEFWRSSDYLSPISSAGGHQLEDSEMSHVFREINSNLNELRRKLNQFEGVVPEETSNEQQPSEAEVDIEDQTEAYIRDLLIVAGLYDGSFDRSLSKWDPLGKFVSTQVFKEVEENYKTKNYEKCVNEEGENVNHTMILDLLNEVLPAVLREPTNRSRYMEKAHVHNPLRGRELLSQVWNIVRVYIHPPVERSYYDLDNMLASHLDSNPWSRLMDDDVNIVGRDIEYGIIEDMIEEIIEDMYST